MEKTAARPITDLASRDMASVWHPFTQMMTADPPIAIVAAQGAVLYTETGEEILDMVSSWWTTVHGHSHPHIAQKVSEQLQTLEHVIFAGFTHPPAIELAERLLKRLPDGQKRIFYSDNGSTAVEVGLKMALQYWYNQGKPRPRILALENAYHGDTFGAMSVSGRGGFNAPFEQLMFEVDYIPTPVPGAEAACLERLEALLETHAYASFIFEPLVQGAGGMLMYTPQILDQIIAKVRATGALIHADEVMTGFCRTGTFFATDQIEHEPDIFSLSKGLTGGTMALSVTSCSQAVYDAFLSADKMKTFFHGHSFTANPTACSSALASLDLFDADEGLQNIQRIVQQHANFAERIRGNRYLKEVRQTGTILAMEFDTGEQTSYFNNLRDQLYHHFLERGILLRPLGNVLYLLPPYCITNAQLMRVYSEIEALLHREQLFN